MRKRNLSPSCSSPCRPIKYRIVEYHCKGQEVGYQNITIFFGNYNNASLTHTSAQKRGRLQSCSPGRPFKYSRMENPAVGHWRSSITACVKHANSTSASKRSRHRSQSSSPHRPVKYLIVDEFRKNRLNERSTRIWRSHKSDGENLIRALKRSRSQYCSSPCRPVKYRIIEQNKDRVVEHRDIPISAMNVIDARLTRKSSQKRYRSKSWFPGRPLKYPIADSLVVERRRSSFYKSSANSIGGASKRSRCRSQSCSPHRPIKYLIVDMLCQGRVVGQVSRKSNTTNSMTIYDEENSNYTITRKRSRSPSCSDQCYPVKCLILDVDTNIEDCMDYEDCADHDNPSDVIEHEQFFILFNDDKEDCRLDIASCFCILVYVNALLRKDSSELIQLSVTQVFLFGTQ